MKIVITNKRCALFVCLTSTRWWRVCIRVFLYVCMCVRLSWDFLLLRFQTERRGRSCGSTRETKSVATFFFDIYIFRKKKRETLVADAEATPATAVVAFVLSMYYYDAQILSRFNPPLLSFSFHRPGFLFFSFLFFSFFLSFFFPLLFLFLLLSPWVMSNLRVLCI